MTGCGEFIFPVAVIDVAILPELRCGMFCCLHQSRRSPFQRPKPMSQIRRAAITPIAVQTAS
jgi:hypothetical protein